MNNEKVNPVALSPVVRRAEDRAAQPANGVGANSAGDGSPARKPRSDAPNLFRMLHHALRGRYLLVIIGGVLVAGACAVTAWRYTHPVYASDALVHIAFSMPVVRTSTDQNQGLPMFDTFMESQKTLITSRRVIDMAVLGSGVAGLWPAGSPGGRSVFCRTPWRRPEVTQRAYQNNGGRPGSGDGGGGGHFDRQCLCRTVYPN